MHHESMIRRRETKLTGFRIFEVFSLGGARDITTTLMAFLAGNEHHQQEIKCGDIFVDHVPSAFTILGYLR
jgi:hypothetical protein